MIVLSGCGGAGLVGTSAQAGSLSASPGLVSFGSVAVGQAVNSNVAVSNTGPSTVQIAKVSVTGQAFSVSGVGDLPIAIAPGGTYNVNVTFAPQATGTASGQLTIATSAAANAVVIGMNGAGTTAAPSSGPALSVSSSTVAFGNVGVNSVATQSLTISSNGSAAVSISAVTVVGAGFSLSQSSVPTSLTSGQTATLNVQFNPTVTGPSTGVLTIASDSSLNPATTINLNGYGVTGGGQYQVTLSWNAPISSPDPVAGYNLYRSPSGASSYQLVNSSVVTGTTFTDSTVQSGQNYDYIVESVDASGAESAPSNTASVAVP